MSCRDDDSVQSTDDLVRDVSYKHTPDSVRQEAYRELERRGYTHREAQQMADDKYGDFWG